MSDRPILKRKTGGGRRPGSKNKAKREAVVDLPPSTEPSPPAPVAKPKKASRTNSRRKAKGGRPLFRPTDEQREYVECCIAGGMMVPKIARLVGISEPTFRKHFASEIELGVDRKHAEVLVAMIRCARNGNVSAQKSSLDVISAASADREVRQRGNVPAEAASPVITTKQGKKEVAADMAKEAATGLYAVPPPPRMVVDNTRK